MLSFQKYFLKRGKENDIPAPCSKDKIRERGESENIWHCLSVFCTTCAWDKALSAQMPRCQCDA
jgi:hypothetical protein